MADFIKVRRTVPANDDIHEFRIINPLVNIDNVNHFSEDETGFIQVIFSNGAIIQTGNTERDIVNKLKKKGLIDE